MCERDSLERFGAGNERRLRHDEIERLPRDRREEAAPSPVDVDAVQRRVERGERERAFAHIGADDLRAPGRGHDRQRTRPGRDVEQATRELDRQRCTDLLRRRAGRHDGVRSGIGPVTGNVGTEKRHQPSGRDDVLVVATREARVDEHLRRVRADCIVQPFRPTGASYNNSASSGAAESVRASRTRRTAGARTWSSWRGTTVSTSATATSVNPAAREHIA